MREASERRAGGSWSRGGMRHVLLATLPALDIDPMFPASGLLERRCANETPRAVTSPTTLPPIRMLKMTVSEMPGNRTDPVRITESITSTARTPPVKRLSLRELTHGTSTALLLQSGRRNTVV